MRNIVCLLLLLVWLGACTNVQFLPGLTESEKPTKPLKLRPTLELDSNVQVLYRFTQGGDLGPTGCREIHILFSGETLFYSNCLLPQMWVFRTDTQPRSKEFLLLVEQFNVINYPEIIPKGTANFRWPSSHFTLAFRLNRGDDPKIISANLSADHQYYPDGFFDFLSRIYSLIEGVEEAK